MKEELEYQKRRFEEIEKDWERNFKTEVSSELHDNILSGLSGARLLSESIQIKLEETGDEELIETHRTEHQALKDVYNDLRSYVDDLRLTGAYHIQSNILVELSEFIKSTLKPTRIEAKVDTQLESSITKLPDEIQMALVKVVKEILNNMMKHSEATKCYVKMKWGGDMFSLSIFDNGVGFESESLERKNGLSNIKNRINNAGGSINILSQADEGTLIDIDFDLTVI